MNNPARRSIRFESFDEIMPEVERLARGHSTVGNWSLAQICRHLANVLRGVVDAPPVANPDTSQRVDEETKRQVFASGQIADNMPAPPGVLPEPGLDLAAEVEGLRAAIGHYRQSPGPVIPHRFFGELDRDEWDALQRIHCAHHLNFAVPGPAGA